MTLPVISRGLVNSVRKNMLTRGYALVDTSCFLENKKWPSPKSQDVFTNYVVLAECETDWIKKLIDWQERLLKRALPEEGIYNTGLDSLSLRNERYKFHKVCKWHVDGYYIRSICVVKGVPTQIKTPLGDSPIPVGWSLFITGNQRVSALKVRGTLHRRPQSDKLRRVIVHGWYGVG